MIQPINLFSLATHYADGVPNMTIELEEITPYNLGKYHYMLMKATTLFELEF